MEGLAAGGPVLVFWRARGAAGEVSGANVVVGISGCVCAVYVLSAAFPAYAYALYARRGAVRSSRQGSDGAGHFGDHCARWPVGAWCCRCCSCETRAVEYCFRRGGFHVFLGLRGSEVWNLRWLCGVRPAAHRPSGRDGCSPCQVAILPDFEKIDDGKGHVREDWVSRIYHSGECAPGPRCCQEWHLVAGKATRHSNRTRVSRRNSEHRRLMRNEVKRTIP